MYVLAPDKWLCTLSLNWNFWYNDNKRKKQNKTELWKQNMPLNSGSEHLFQCHFLSAEYIFEMHATNRIKIRGCRSENLVGLQLLAPLDENFKCVIILSSVLILIVSFFFIIETLFLWAEHKIDRFGVHLCYDHLNCCYRALMYALVRILWFNFEWKLLGMKSV